MPSSTPCDAERLAKNLVRGAFMELYLTPKPGLVDQSDNGSHPNLCVSRMEASLEILMNFLMAVRDSLLQGETLEQQVSIGIEAERAMLRMLGTNCHKGYIFLSGVLLVASMNTASQEERALSEAVANLAQQLFSRPADPTSNGSLVRRRYQVGGIRAETLRGLPSLFQEALPAFREEIASGGNRGTATFAMLARLMQTVEDTTALFRCGTDGLNQLRQDGRELERLITKRGDFLSFLSTLNQRYVEMNLTMGGVADVLALAFAWLSHTGELDPPRPQLRCHTTAKMVANLM
jgi:triphosphoribosyl-dephospho-CoA synthetase